MTTNKEKIIWSGYSFAQEQVVKEWRTKTYKEMIAKKHNNKDSHTFT
jgi:hypothetical protein